MSRKIPTREREERGLPFVKDRDATGANGAYIRWYVLAVGCFRFYYKRITLKATEAEATSPKQGSVIGQSFKSDHFVLNMITLNVNV